MLLERRRRRKGMTIGEELCKSVPSLFRCPISLDVMRSPVSLSTGVTYDRSSIQKWLDGGNNTCPATMQVLQSKDLVPNLTLHRLIQIWSDETHHPITNNSVPSRDQARDLVAELRRDYSMITRNSCSAGEKLEKIARFAAESDDNRRYLVKSLDGFLALMVDLLSSSNVELISERALRIIAATTTVPDESAELKRLLLSQSGDSHRRRCLMPLLRVLESNGSGSSSSSASKISAAQVIEMVANDAESKLIVSEVCEGRLLPQLLGILTQEQGTTTESSLMEATLSCLISLSTAKRVKVKLIRLGLVAALSKQLLLLPSSSICCTERMLKLLETVSSCKKGRAEICEDPDCVPAVLGKSMKVSKTATEHAVTILWSVCYLFRDHKAQDAVTRNNGLTKILLVMQSDSPAGVRQMAGDLLKIFKVNSKSCLSTYDTKTSHIMPF